MDEALVEKVRGVLVDSHTAINDGHYRTVARTLVTIVGEACAGVADRQATRVRTLVEKGPLTEARHGWIVSADVITQAIRAATGAGE